MRRTKNVSFKTDKRQDRASLRRLLFAACAGAVILLAVSLFVILSKNNYNFKSAMGVNVETETSGITRQTEIKLESSDRLYYLWCASSDKKVMHFSWLVRVRMPERTVTIFPISPGEQAELEGETQTFSDYFALYGERRLLEAMGAYCGRSIDGYVASTDESFRSMINYFGGVDITVPEQIEYRGDFTLILVKGRQNMKGDTLFKYLKYITLLGNTEGRYEAFSDILETVLTQKNEGRLDKIFSKFSNTLNTNISIVEFSRAENGIKALIEEGAEIRRADSAQELLSNKYKRKQ